MDARSERASRALTIWAIALVGIVAVGFVGKLFERRPAALPLVTCCDARVGDDQAGVAEPRAIVVGDPGHSIYRFVYSRSTITMQLSGFPSLDTSEPGLTVSGQIEGPVGNVAVELVQGSKTLARATRFYSPISGRPPAKSGAFDIWLALPANTAMSDLWVVARAYVDGHVVGVTNLPVSPAWRTSGPDRFVLDDVVTGRGLHADL